MILELSEMSNSSINGLKILDRAPFVYVASIGLRLYIGVVPPFCGTINKGTTPYSTSRFDNKMALD